MYMWRDRLTFDMIYGACVRTKPQSLSAVAGLGSVCTYWQKVLIYWGREVLGWGTHTSVESAGWRGGGTSHWSASHEVLLVHAVGMVWVAITGLHLHCPMHWQHCAHGNGGVLGLWRGSQALRTCTIAG